MRTQVRLNVLDVLRVNFHLQLVKACVLCAHPGGRPVDWNIHSVLQIYQPFTSYVFQLLACSLLVWSLSSAIAIAYELN